MTTLYERWLASPECAAAYADAYTDADAADYDNKRIAWMAAHEGQET